MTDETIEFNGQKLNLKDNLQQPACTFRRTNNRWSKLLNQIPPDKGVEITLSQKEVWALRAFICYHSHQYKFSVYKTEKENEFFVVNNKKE